MKNVYSEGTDQPAVRLLKQNRSSSDYVVAKADLGLCCLYTDTSKNER